MISQILFIIAGLAFAFFDALEESAWSHPFRYFSDEQYKEKRKYLKKAHRFGALGVGSIAAIICISGIYDPFVALRNTIMFLLSYYIVFDPVFAVSIGQKWTYLKDDGWDGFIKNVFGKNATLIKTIICLFFLISLLFI